MLPYVRHISKINLLDYVHPVCHFDFYMIFVIRGKFMVETDEGDLTLRTNDLFIVPPAVAYKVTGLSEERLVYTISFDMDGNHAYFPFIHCEAADIFDPSLAIFPENMEDCCIRHYVGCDFARDLIDKIFVECLNGDLYYNDICNAILQQLILECDRRNFHKNPLIIDRVIAYINDNYTKKISNKQVAERFGYHTVHLNRLFLKYMNTTLHRYIIDCRLREARRLLVSTDMSIAEISEAVGFDYPEYFTKVYKDSFSATPTQTRQIQSLLV